MFVLGILGGVVLAIAIAFLPAGHKRLTIGIVGQYTEDSLPSEILNELSEGLTRVGPDGQPLPGLASSWSVSSDFTTYKFYLLPNQKWVDGTPVRAEELNYHFKDALMRGISNTVVEVQLKESYTPFPVIVSRPLFKRDFVGVGPYRLAAIKTAGSQVTEVDLSAMEGTGKPDLAYHIYPTEASAITAWKLGEVGTVEDLSVVPLNGWKVKISTDVRKDRFVGLFFDTQDPVVSDKTIRQAIAYAIKDKVPEGAVRAYGPISPDSWAFNPNLKSYDYDLPHAKEMLAKVATNAASLKLTISTFPTLLPMAESIKNDLGGLGMSVDLRVVPGTPDNFQMLLATQAIPPDPDQYDLWHSTQPPTSNITRLDKPRIDKLLADGRKTDGMTARKPIYWDFQKTLVEETPVVFLYHPLSYALSRE